MEQNFKLQNVQNLVLYHIIIAKEIAKQNYIEKIKKMLELWEQSWKQH